MFLLTLIFFCDRKYAYTYLFKNWVEIHMGRHIHVICNEVKGLNLREATLNLQKATLNLQKATLNLRKATFNLRMATLSLSIPILNLSMPTLRMVLPLTRLVRSIRHVSNYKINNTYDNHISKIFHKIVKYRKMEEFCKRDSINIDWNSIMSEDYNEHYYSYQAQIKSAEIEAKAKIEAARVSGIEAAKIAAKSRIKMAFMGFLATVLSAAIGYAAYTYKDRSTATNCATTTSGGSLVISQLEALIRRSRRLAQQLLNALGNMVSDLFKSKSNVNYQYT